MKGHQEVWLLEGHYVVQFDYWLADMGDNRGNPPMGHEVAATSAVDLLTGATLIPQDNPNLFELLARTIERRLSESFEERHS